MRLTETQHVLANLIEVASLSFLRGMQDNDSGAKNGEETANLPMEVEPLFQQVGGEHSTVYDMTYNDTHIQFVVKYIHV